MLTVKELDTFFQRIGIGNIDLLVLSQDSYGDIISATDPERSFDEVKSAILAYPPYSSRIVDNGVSFVEVRDIIYVNGLKTVVSFLVSKSDNQVGTNIKANVKSVTCFLKGEAKLFSGFEALAQYKDRFVV